MSTKERATAAEAASRPKPATVTLAAEGKLAEGLAEGLTEVGWRVRQVESLSALAELDGDVVIAAHGFRGGEVEELCERVLRESRSRSSPLLMVIDAPRERRVAYLEAGADAVVGPGAGAEEIVARVQALVRRMWAERERSPLSGLPGNARLEQVMRERLAADEPVAVLMLDIDNFKAFNDCYGHWRGDKVIQMLAGIARQAAAREPQAFVAHVGGDDVYVVTTPALVNEIAEVCRAQFDAQAASHYDESDRRRGYITTHSRTGHRRQFKLMTLTLAAATAEAKDMEHIGQFFQVLAELKEHGKGQAGSTYVRDRRRDHEWDRQ